MSKDKLHDLIRSLSSSERRYFKQYLKRYSQNSHKSNYSRLFDYLAEVSTYNKEHLLEHCTFISKQQLQNIRYRLYNHVLEGLRAYYADGSFRIELHQMMINAEILTTKGLFLQALGLLQKAETIASNFEYYSLLEEILAQQENLTTIRLKSKNHKQLLKDIQKKRQQLSVTRDRLADISLFRRSVYDVFRIEGRMLRDQSETKEVNLFMQKIENEGGIDQDSFQEIFNYEIARSILFRMEGRLKKSLQSLDTLSLYFEQHTDLIKVHPQEYSRLLSARVIVLNVMGAFEQSEKENNAIKKWGSKLEDKEVQLLVFETTVFHGIEIYLYQMKFQKAVAIIEENFPKIDELKEDFHSVNQQSKFYRIALAYFGAGNYKIALAWINKIINYDVMKYRKDIIASVHLLNLLVHYELGNYDLLKNRITTTEAYLKKIDRWLPSEKSTLRSLRRIVVYGKDANEHFEKLSAKLRHYRKKNELEQYFFAYFDFEQWLKNKCG